jgi:hypothetical protein
VLLTRSGHPLQIPAERSIERTGLLAVVLLCSSYQDWGEGAKLDLMVGRHTVAFGAVIDTPAIASCYTVSLA